MPVETSSVLVFVAVLVAVVGGTLLGGLGLMAAIVILAFAVLALSGEVQSKLSPPLKEPPHPMRFACPSCGGDAYAGQAHCSACGAALPTAVPTQA